MDLRIDQSYARSIGLPRPDHGRSPAITRASATALGGDNSFGRWHAAAPAESESESWLLSYLDLITLLLSVLVVMLALARLHSKTEHSVASTAGAPVELVGTLRADGFQGPLRGPSNPGIPATLAAAFPARLGSGFAATYLTGVDPMNLYTAAIGTTLAPGPNVEIERSVTSDGTHKTAAAVTASAATASAGATPALKLPSAKELGLDGLDSSVDVIFNEKSVSFRISDDLLFASGKSALSVAGLDVLRRIAIVLNKNDYPVSVEGHSDAVGIRNKQFASNWELSSGRATSVLRQLARNGVKPQRLRAIGYAQTRPLQSNHSAAGRSANRRVELVMEIIPAAQH